MATLNDKALEFLQRTPTSSKDRVFPEDLNEHALQKLNCTPAAITDPVFSESVEEMSRRVKFVCSTPPGAPRTLRGAWRRGLRLGFTRGRGSPSDDICICKRKNTALKYAMADARDK